MAREFVCTSCGYNIWQAIDDEFDFPVCCVCRWLDERPQIPIEVRNRIKNGEAPGGPD